MTPPLREEADRQALIAGLRDGTIDCIATDHAPHAREEKEVPFEQAPMGTTGLETAFASLYTDLVVPGVLPLALVVDKLSAGAALLDLPLPRIAVGAPADFCLIDLEAAWEVGEHGYGTRFDGDLCAAGTETTGEVVFTTGMSGYQEAVTDPSFNSQVITFTYPHVGNYGVSEDAMESDRVHARAVIMREAVDRADAPGADGAWLSRLRDAGIPGL